MVAASCPGGNCSQFRGTGRERRAGGVSPLFVFSRSPRLKTTGGSRPARLFSRRIARTADNIPVRTTVAGPAMTDGDTWREGAIRDAVLAGNAQAWRQWYDAHFDRLAAYVRWRCGGLRDLADDVLQETWLIAVRRLRAFDPAKGAFFDWLCGIASNAARSAIRARCRQKARGRTLLP